MKLTVHIPQMGWSHIEDDSEAKALAELEAKYPQHRGSIMVKQTSKSRYSIDEIKALETDEG